MAFELLMHQNQIQGGLSALEAARGHAGVREAANHFFTRYLATLRLEGAGR